MLISFIWGFQTPLSHNSHGIEPAHQPLKRNLLKLWGTLIILQTSQSPRARSTALERLESGVSAKCEAFNGLAAVHAYQCAEQPVFLSAKYTPSCDSALVSILKICILSVEDGAAQGVQLGIEEAS